MTNTMCGMLHISHNNAYSVFLEFISIILNSKFADIVLDIGIFCLDLSINFLDSLVLLD